MKRYKTFLFLIFGAVACLMQAGCTDANNKTMGNFDSESWKAQRGRESVMDNPRGQMAGTLINNVLKKDMPREEVLALLGPADFQKGEKDYYELGRSPYGIDLEYFVVEYAQDRMVKAFIERG